MDALLSVSSGIDDNETSEYETDDEQNAASEIITLNACGIVTSWKPPPYQTECPVVRCKWHSLDTRSTFHSHFEKVHAKNAIYCAICEKPVMVHWKSQFLEHYNRVHPTVADPFDFIANKKPSSSQTHFHTTRFNSRANRKTKKCCPCCDDFSSVSRSHEKRLSKRTATKQFKVKLIIL